MAERRSLEAKRKGIFQLYNLSFTLELEDILEKAKASGRSSWTSCFTVQVGLEKVDMDYTLSWPKAWAQDLKLVGSQKHIKISSFQSKLSKSWSKAHSRKWRAHETMFKTHMEEKVGTKLEDMHVDVEVALLRKYEKPKRRDDELVKSMLGSLEETADVELRGKGFVAKAHSSVLSLRSSPFNAMFARWGEERPFVFNLDESITENVAKSMVEYFYTLEVPEVEQLANNRPLFRLADQLGLDSLVQAWSQSVHLGEDAEVEEVMLWPELDLPQMSILKERVAARAKQLSMTEIRSNGLELAREVLLAVRKRQKSTEEVLSTDDTEGRGCSVNADHQCIEASGKRAKISQPSEVELSEAI